MAAMALVAVFASKSPLDVDNDQSGQMSRVLHVWIGQLALLLLALYLALELVAVRLVPQWELAMSRERRLFGLLVFAACFLATVVGMASMRYE